VDELLRLLDDARADEHGRSRERERHLRRAAEEGARLDGSLVDLAEAGSTVTVRTDCGRMHLGTVLLVARDFCVVAAEHGHVWIALRAITSVRPQVGVRHREATGDRLAVDLLLVEALARVAAERPRLAMVLSGGELVAGELRAVGHDVVTVALEGDPGSVCYVSASAIRTVFRSG
jgi:hypothetical protein